jgi:hypothetical protein
MSTVTIKKEETYLMKKIQNINDFEILSKNIAILNNVMIPEEYYINDSMIRYFVIISDVIKVI